MWVVEFLAVRHRKVHTKKDLLHCSLGDKDIWLRVADPSSKRRALSHAWLTEISVVMRALVTNFTCTCIVPLRCIVLCQETLAAQTRDSLFVQASKSQEKFSW